jgi:hypothetical protein
LQSIAHAQVKHLHIGKIVVSKLKADDYLKIEWLMNNFEGEITVGEVVD